MKRQRDKLDDAALNTLADRLSVLPRDVMRKILKNLSLVEIARLRRMNRRFRETFIDGGGDTSIWTEILNDEAPPDVSDFLLHTFPGNAMALVRLLAFRMSTRPESSSSTNKRWTMTLYADTESPAIHAELDAGRRIDPDSMLFQFELFSRTNRRYFGPKEFEMADTFKQEIEKKIVNFHFQRNTAIDLEIVDCYTTFADKNPEKTLLIFLVAFVQFLLANANRLEDPLNVGTCIQCNAQQAKWREVGNALRVFCSKDCQRAHHIGLGMSEML